MFPLDAVIKVLRISCIDDIKFVATVSGHQFDHVALDVSCETYLVSFGNLLHAALDLRVHHNELRRYVLLHITSMYNNMKQLRKMSHLVVFWVCKARIFALLN